MDLEKTEAWPGVARKPSLLKPFNPLGLPSPLTWQQCFYLAFTQCLGAAAVCSYALQARLNNPSHDFSVPGDHVEPTCTSRMLSSELFAKLVAPTLP
jgi:hypothetical protein